MFVEYSLESQDKWDEIVKSFSTYDLYYLSGYAKAFMVHGDGEPYLLHYNTPDLQAINVIMKRDISNEEIFSHQIEKNAFYDFCTPYGYGGFIFDGNLSKKNIGIMSDMYNLYCKEKKIVSEFVRFNPLLKNHIYCQTIYNIQKTGNTVTIYMHSKEQIWNDLTSKNRNVIRKAIKSGVKIFWSNCDKIIDEFIPIYNDTMNRDNADKYYYFDKTFYQTLFNELKDNALIFYAKKDEIIISAAIILFANKKMHYHLSASKIEYQYYAPTNYLLLEAAYWGLENGMYEFHLGGGVGNREDGLYKFKKSFNKNNDTHFNVGKKIFDTEAYTELCSLRKLVEQDDFDFFPKYRSKIR